MSQKIPAIKTPKAPSMSDYKSTAQASHGEKLKAMGFAGGGSVLANSRGKPLPINITHGPAAAHEMAGMEKEAKGGLKPEFAGGGTVPAGHGKPSTVNVIHGKAAEREMARMEREAKASGNLRRPKGG
jgi:hypothetical protein